MLKEDFLYLMGDTPETDEFFVDSFLYKGGSAKPFELWDFTKSFEGQINRTISIPTAGLTISDNGVQLNARTDNIEMGIGFIGGDRIEFDIGDLAFNTFSGNGVLFQVVNGSSNIFWFGWNINTSKWVIYTTAYIYINVPQNVEYFSNKTITIQNTSDGKFIILCGEDVLYQQNSIMEGSELYIGSHTTQRTYYTMNMLGVRYYKG